MKKQNWQRQQNSCRLNYQIEHRQKLHLARWNAERFEGKKSFNIVLNLRSYIIDYKTNWKSYINIEEVHKTSRLFKNKVNQYCFGSLYRHSRKMEVILTANYQHSPCKEEKLQHHLHIHLEIPYNIQEEDLREFVIQFAERTDWIQNQIPYIEITKSNLGTQFYNTRDGESTLILF